MLAGTRHPIVVGILCCLLTGGCRTSSPLNFHSRKRPVFEAGRQSLPGDAAMQKLAEAHAHYAAGVIEDVDEHPEAALNEYQQAALKDPENEELSLEVARRFLQHNQPENALDILSRAAARPNASAAIYSRLGFVYTQLGKHDEAVSASRTAIKKAPAALDGYQTLLLAYLQKKQPQEAAKVLEEASKQSKASPEFLMGTAELYIHLGLQDPPQRKDANAKALALLNRIEKKESLNASLRLKLAEDYSAVGESAKAAVLYQELLKKMPELPGLRGRVGARLAEIYLRGNDNKAAAAQLEKLIQDDPANAQAHYALARLAMDENQFEKAESHLSKAILLSPENPAPYADMVRVQLATKKISDALATLDRARVRFPETFLFEYLSGAAFAQQKAYPEAIQHYTKAEVIAKATEEKWLDEHFYFDIGAAYERKGDLALAEKSFEKCIQLAPEFAEALNYLGYMWAEKGLNLARARELIEKAVKLEPKNAAYLDSLAWVLFKLDEPKNALEYILKAVELSKEPDATLFDHLGDIYASIHMMDKAREAWEKSLKLEANDAVQKKVTGSGP